MPDTLSFSDDGGVETITVTDEWSWDIVTNNTSWNHITKNGNQITVRVDKNTNTSSRSDWFTIKLGDEEKRVNIFQEGGPITLSVSSEKLEYRSSGGTQIITITTNGDWEIATSPASWGHLTKNGDQLTVRVDQNTSTISRNSHFTIRSGDKVKQINITQDAASALYLTVDGSSENRPKHFSYSGGYQYYSVNTNADNYQIWGLPSWCKIENKTSSGFRLVCESNPNYSNRDDYFKVMVEGLEIRINVYQEGKPNTTTSTSSYPSTKRRTNRFRGRDYYRFPTGGEWQSMIGFNAGVIGHYHSPVDVYNGTVNLFHGKGIHFEDNSSFAWDVNYIGGGLFSKTFFVGFGLGISGYQNKDIHKKDLSIPLYLHLKWYMAGNSAVSPYIATSQGAVLYLCQDVFQTDRIIAVHSRYDIGLHIRPDLDSKFGISIACEFGFAPYRITSRTNSYYRYLYKYDRYNSYSHEIKTQLLHNETFLLATYIGGYISIAF